MVKPKRPKLPPLSESQLEIMHVVWDAGETTVSDVWSALSERRQVARNTVLTQMDRLVKKGWLKQRSAPEGQAHHYSAAVTRTATMGDLVTKFVDTAFAGSAENLVLALLDSKGLDSSEAHRIRQLIDEARRKKS
jgi:predicted transcriptional regulator